jgi:hypothetical protein
MGQDKREIPRQNSNLMQTPEKMGSNDNLISGPSPKGEMLSQILSGGLNENRSSRETINFDLNSQGAGSRAGSTGSRQHNVSVGSVGSMNVSNTGYGSDAINKGGKQESILQDIGPAKKSGS